MRNQKPPFEITNQMIDYVAEIAELVGKLSAVSSLSANPTLRRGNRIRTIHGSLAIEQNTLSLEQVTAVLNGKHVLAPPKDIAEVKNAYEIYERLDELDPYSADDLLTAHGIMTRGLVEESGVFRTRPVGVVDSDYRGEVKVPLHNHSEKAYTVSPGERIAQMVIAPVFTPELVEVNELEDTARADGGFGSTGRS